MCRGEERASDERADVVCESAGTSAVDEAVTRSVGARARAGWRAGTDVRGGGALVEDEDVSGHVGVLDDGRGDRERVRAVSGAIGSVSCSSRARRPGCTWCRSVCCVVAHRR